MINNVKILNSHGGSLWLFFSSKRHEGLSRIEKQVHKIKKHLKQTQIFEQFNMPTYSCSEIETFLASILTTINSRPLCIYKNDIITPQSYYHHNFTISPLTQNPNPLIQNTQEELQDLEDQIKTVISEQDEFSQVEDIEQFKHD